MDLMIGPEMPGAPSARLDDELLDGARLYAEPSLTGLNSQPVDDHAAFALLGARIVGAEHSSARGSTCGRPLLPERGPLARTGSQAGAPAPPDAAGRVPTVDLQKLTLRLLHSGSVALLRGESGYRFLNGLVLDDPAQPFDERRFAQRFSGVFEGRVRTITRVFSRNGGETGIDGETPPLPWFVRDYIAAESGSDEPRLIAEQQLPGADVLAHPNGVGVLYKAQLGYRRLERIFATVERLQSGVNAKTIVSGYLGNVDQAHEELRRPDADVALFPTGASINRVASTAAIDQLMREFDTLLPLYLRRLHIVDVSSDPRMSGVSRRLALAPMLAYIDHVRAQISAVLARLGCTASFERLRLESIEERTQKYALLKLMQGDGVLSPAQFAAQSAGLLEG